MRDQKSQSGRKSGKAMQIYQKNSISNVLLTLLILILISGCGEKKEATSTQVISKKISVGKDANTTGKSDEVKASSTADIPESPVLTKTKEANGDQRIYDSQARINPFIPLFKAKSADGAKSQDATGSETGKKRKKRIPQTPLEKIGLDQLKLVAVIRAPSGNRALMEDNTGKGYIIKNGTYVGLNAGMVTQINVDNVIIEEELENLKGELVLQNTEIKLQKPAGE